MNDTSTAAKNALQEAGKTATQAAKNVAEGAKNTVDYVTEQAKDAAARASQNVAATSAQLDKQASSALSGGLRAAADAVRENGPSEGRLGQASTRVAQTLTDGGEYLEREGLAGVLETVANMIRSNPLPAFAVGIGIGYFLLRPFSRRA